MLVELAEYERVDGLGLTAPQVAGLRAAGGLAVGASPRNDGTWELRAASHVGVVQADGVEVRIRPKMPVGRLLFLLAYACDPKGWKPLAAGFAEADDLVAVVAMGFAHHAEAALARGVLQGYRTTEEALPALRGRLREGDQLRRRYALPLPLEVTYDDFTVDVAENRLLRSAARRLLLLAGVPEAGRRRLRHLLARLDGVAELAPGRPLPAVAPTRLNARYGPALRLAELVLHSASVGEAAGGRAAVAFLFDMNRVFEDFVAAALAAELGRRGGRARSQHHDVLDHGRRINIVPDLTWWDGPRCIAVVDAKYKRVAPAGLVHADVYQVLAYCLALGVGTGHLVYAAGDEGAATHAVRNASVRIDVSVLDLDQPPERLLGAVAALADAIEAAAAPPRRDASAETPPHGGVHSPGVSAGTPFRESDPAPVIGPPS